MKTKLFGGAAAIGLLSFATGAMAQDAAPTISDAIGAGKLILEARLRYENVDQQGTVRSADGTTLRTRLGWESAEWKGFRLLGEAEDVRHVSPEKYNVAIPGPGGASLNGKIAYPIINDPEVTEVNRAQLSWTPGPLATVTVGRQRIELDDQRFIGSVSWRQDQQTFDGARIDAGYGRFKGTYAYISKVNRVFGEARDWRSDSHLVNLTFSPSEAFRLQGFAYALDFGNSSANSNITKGVKATGKFWIGLYPVTYGATYAQQEDYGNNPAKFDLDYKEVDIASTYDIWTGKLGYEEMQGDGSRGFFTPLATTHLFNGWADAFATAGGNKTHVDGIKDLYGSLQVLPRWRWTYWQNTALTMVYHDYKAQRTGAKLATEWDAQLQAAITTKLTFLAKYADFNREETVPAGTTLAPADRRKMWVSLEYKF